MQKRVCVLGAGSVGISTALQLLLKGWKVTLIDAKEPASETSYGNAGVISNGSIVPLNNPDMFKSLPAYMSNLHPAIRYNVAYCMQNFSWMKQFLSNGREANAAENAKDLHSLLDLAADEHHHFMKLAGNAKRYSETGWLKVYREDHKNLALKFDRRTLALHGVDAAELNVNELRDLEPDLRPIFVGGFWIKGNGSVNNPAELLREYTNYFINAGGQFHQQKIQAITEAEEGYLVQCDDEVIQTDSVVVAMGPWSREILEPLGYKIPLVFERGYHLNFQMSEGTKLSRSVYDVDGAYVMTPMENGLRVTCGVELNQRDAQDNLAQLDLAAERVVEAIALDGKTEAERWRGARPSLPDSKPIIGRAPNHENLWLAFGHGHIGLNSGPITGKLLAQAMSDETPDIDLQPFSASRFE